MRLPRVELDPLPETLERDWRRRRSRPCHGDRCARAHPADLRDHGLTRHAVERLGAVLEAARRYGEEEFVSGQPFKGSYDIYAHFRERLAAETREHFLAVLLDNKHRKLRDVTI